MGSMMTLDRDSACRQVLALFPPLDGLQAAAATAIYRGIAEDGRVSIAGLAEKLNLDADAVRMQLAETPAIYYDDAGAIQGFWGLTDQPVSPHRMRIRGKDRYAWCAWDALFLPQLVGDSAEVSSTCPGSGAEVRLLVHPESVEQLTPPGAVVSLRVPDRDGFAEDVLGTFCHHVFFFVNEETGRAWAGDRNDIVLLSVAEAFALGREKNHIQFGV